MSRDFGSKQLKQKRYYGRVKTMENLTTLVWKERRQVYMDLPEAEENFCDDSRAPKLVARPRAAKTMCASRAVLTKTGQRNHPSN